MERKKSFFERLTGAINTNRFDEEIDMDIDSHHGPTKNIRIHPHETVEEKSSWIEHEEQLDVDVFQNDNEVIIRTFIAGVRPDTVDVQISRDTVTLRGTRQESNEIKGNDYITKELYWGTFARTISLPAEIDVEEAEATEEHGLLTLKLPKIDKDRRTRLRIQSQR